MIVKDYKDVLEKLEKCDFVEYHGYATVTVTNTVPVKIRINKGTTNWKSYVEYKTINWDKDHHDMNNGYGYWNHKHFPEVCNDHDVTSLCIKECFFSIRDELIKHVPEERLDRNQETQNLIDSVQENLKSISDQTN